MPGEMTLNLKLTGVRELLSAIKDLNKALTVLNRKFSDIAQSVNQTASKVAQAAGSVKQMAGIPSARQGAGGPGNRGSKPPKQSGSWDPQDIASVLFSGFSGAWRNVMAKIMTRISIPVMQGYKSGGITGAFGGLFQALGALGKLGLIAAIAAAAIAVLAVAVRGMVNAIKAIASAANNAGKLLWAVGQNSTRYNQLRNIGASAGFDENQMTGMIGSDPSQGRILLNKLKILRSMDEASAQRYAQFNGINQDLAQRVRHMSESDFQKASGSGNQLTSKIAQRSGERFTQALGELGSTWREFLQVISPLLEWVTQGLKFLASALKGAVIVIEYFRDSVIKTAINIVNFFSKDKIKFEDVVKNLNNASRNLNNAADKITNKGEGIYGGDVKAQNAMPKSWTYYNYQNKLIDMADALGAFEY